MKNTKDFFLSCIDEENKFLIYKSEPFKFSEVEILNLIKICIIEQRSKKIGKKILDVYKDAVDKRNAKIKLNKIGIEYDEKEPITSKRTKTK